jgi:phosphoglycolate phosphatase-like HAD superfamily hydrolase
MDMSKLLTTGTTGWLRGLTPAIEARVGRVRHALFDFDGTLSLIREGWEGVMIPMMIEMICDGDATRPEIGAALADEVAAEVAAYVDRSTGILTIEQMAWLAEAVRRYGLAAHPLTAAEYKAIYLERMMGTVRLRLARLTSGQLPPAEMMVEGAAAFVEALCARGVTLYLASGSDHPNVVEEAEALGVARYFAGGIYGALDGSAANNKSAVIANIIRQHDLHGDELLVVGDGPVEIRHGVDCGAITLGVASDEIRRYGWNEAKIGRLTAAGAALLVADFQQHAVLARTLCG